MRVACVYLPSFPLQVHVRRAPHLAGRSFAVVAGTSPAVLVCSRSAWNAGVRPGMSAAAARAACPDLHLLNAEPELYRRALAALADSLLVHSPLIDIGGAAEPTVPHHALYLEVSPTARGNSFGQRLLVQLSRQGFRGRVGIADDRFAAWAAATSVGSGAAHAGRPGASSPLFSQRCTTVPRGGSAAFLAPLSINLLPLDRDILELLATLGVHSLGEFAALPPPSAGRAGPDGDYQRLARGDGPATLEPYCPTGPIAETIELGRPVDELEPLSFMLRPLGDRVCERLRGRGRAAAQVALRLLGPDGEVTELPVRPALPSLTAVSLVDAARRQLAAARVEHPVGAVELEVTREVEPGEDELDLFAGHGSPSASDIDVAIARLQSSFGAESGRPAPRWVSAPAEASHRRTRRGKQRRRRPGGTDQQPLMAAAGAWPRGGELLDPPALQPPGLRTIEVGDMVASAGPSLSRSADGSYEVEADDGGRYWVFRRQADGRFYLHGIFE